MPHIQILNERFISRYGVDRILLLMADHFIKMGARVSFGCLRYNEELFNKDTNIVKLPAFTSDIFANVGKFMNAEKSATEGMVTEWLNDKPDLILVGGWPFFDLAARAASFGVRTVFIDAGAVPHTGYPDSSRAIQQELRRIRSQTLPFIEKILPISDFIRYSQTEPDRCSSQGVRTIHLGADHLRNASPSPDVIKEEVRFEEPIFEDSTSGRQEKNRHDARRVELLMEFGLFDERWYKTRYEDVAIAEANSRLHFLNSGSYELRDPGPSFSSKSYLLMYPDVAAAKMEPWLHYVLHGRKEKRAIISVDEAEQGSSLKLPLLSRLRNLKRAKRKLVLMGGRFEATGYKNSIGAVNVTRGIREVIPEMTLLILEKTEYLPIPDDMKKYIEGIGNPSDSELLEIIRLSDLTLSTSLWEGFNLPLAESQVEGCPALAYACGSHPEVIADPWFLCKDEAEMAKKAVKILDGEIPDTAAENLRNYSQRYMWTRTLSEIWAEIDSLLHSRPPPDKRADRRLVFLDASNSAVNSMDMRTFSAARALWSGLVHHPLLEIVFTCWDEAAKSFVLACGNGPNDLDNSLSALDDSWTRHVEIDRLMLASSQRCTSPPLLLFPIALPNEISGPRMDWARGKGLICTGIAHDPGNGAHDGYLLHEMFTPPPNDVKQLLSMDAVICRSQAALEALKAYAEETGTAPIQFHQIMEALPPFGGSDRCEGGPELAGETIRILGVEARGSKGNSVKLLKAFAQLRRRMPDRKIELTLIGHRGDFDGSANWPGEHVEWLSDDTAAPLQNLLNHAHFLICPSLTGSVDLLAAESLWAGRPCICHRDGAAGEFARDGGCLSVDMRSERSIENAMTYMIEDPALYRRLVRDAVTRPLTDWSRFVDGMAEILRVI